MAFQNYNGFAPPDQIINGHVESRVRVMKTEAQPRPGNCAAGFTLIEILIAMFVVGTTLVGMFGLFALTLRTSQEAERRVVATALVNEKMELIRNLPYVDVGTVGGVPSGTIEQQETFVRNNVTYTVDTDIRYVDDPFDGEAGGGGSCVEVRHNPSGNPGNCQDLCVPPSAVNAHLAHGDSTSVRCDGSPIIGPDDLSSDYKQVRVEASWPSPNQPKPVLLITYVAPPGIEGGEDGGTLDFQALNAAGAGVYPATVQITNSSVNPAINLTTQTNVEGRVVLPGFPESSGTYELIVSHSGYTTEQTYDTSATFIPDVDYLHLSVLRGEVTSKTFFIDELSSLSLAFEEGGNDPTNYCLAEPPAVISNYPYTLQGTKTIGTDDSGEPVYVVDVSGASDGGGQATHSDLVWDTYQLAVDGATDGCDIKETSLLLPLVINPGDELEMIVALISHTPISLHVTVTGATGLPVENATVQITDNGVDETSVTGLVGQVFFADLPSNADYTLTIDAPGFESYSEPVTVQDTTRASVALTAS